MCNPLLSDRTDTLVKCVWWISGSGGFCSLSHGPGDFLFAEEDFQQAEFSFELFVLLVLVLHRSTIFFLADSVGKNESLY